MAASPGHTEAAQSLGDSTPPRRLWPGDLLPFLRFLNSRQTPHALLCLNHIRSQGAPVTQLDGVSLFPSRLWAFPAAPERPGLIHALSSRERMLSATGTSLLAPNLKTSRISQIFSDCCMELFKGFCAQWSQRPAIKRGCVTCPLNRVGRNVTDTALHFPSGWRNTALLIVGKMKHTQKCKKNLRWPRLAPSLQPLSQPAQEPDFPTGQPVRPLESPGSSPTLPPAIDSPSPLQTASLPLGPPGTHALSH